jgi:hypothetical protein
VLRHAALSLPVGADPRASAHSGAALRGDSRREEKSTSLRGCPRGAEVGCLAPSDSRLGAEAVSLRARRGRVVRSGGRASNNGHQRPLLVAQARCRTTATRVALGVVFGATRGTSPAATTRCVAHHAGQQNQFIGEQAVRADVQFSNTVHLRGLRKLRWLAVPSATVNYSAVEAAESALPNCKVNWH